MKNLFIYIIACLTFTASAEKPNILFIAIDDLKPMFGCYGNTLVKTPHVDKLAEEGTVFLNAHCQQSVCAPSRASLMTGLRPDTTQVWDLKTKIRDRLPEVVTLPQYFKQHGYTAVGTGKIFDFRSVQGRTHDDPLTWSRPYVVFPKNPASEFGYLDPDFLKKIKTLKTSGLKTSEIKKRLGGFPPVEINMDVPDNAYDDGLIAETGIRLIQELAPEESPFFIAVGFKKPHLPFVAPKKYADLYRRSQFQPNPLQQAPQDAPEYAVQPGWELRNGSYSDVPRLEDTKPFSAALQTELIHGYYACVSYIDAQIGKLLAALEASGEADNTVLVLWGDHGFHLGDHAIWCKHTNYEQATRVPLIIADLRTPKGQTSREPVEFVDLYPTLCELADLPLPTLLEGDSLKPLLEHPTRPVKSAAVSQYPRVAPGHGNVMGYAFRDRRYRYVEWRKADQVIDHEFYDYQKDPQETQNLMERPEYQREINRMKGIASAYHAKWNTFQPTPQHSRSNSPKRAVEPTSSPNLLINADFSAASPAPWKMQSKLDASLSAENNSLTVSMKKSSPTASHRMLTQFDLMMEPETRYILQFEARTEADNGGAMKVSIARSVNWKKGHYGLMRDEQPDREWTQYTYHFTTQNITPEDPACLKIHLGELNGTTQFKNFLLRKERP